MPLKKVALLSMPRTGSTMITRQLSTHPGIFFIGAIFSLKGWDGDGPGRSRLKADLSSEWDDLDFRIAHRDYLLDKLFSFAGADGCCGLKHHLSGAPEITETMIDAPDIGTVMLTRNNILACYSSDKVVRLTSAGALQKSETKKAQFDIAQFEQYMRIRHRIYERWTQRMSVGRGPYMTIDYSEARTQEGIRRILQFIGLDPNGVRAARTLKRNPDDLTERFANADELLSYLKSNGLENWRSESSINS